MKRRLMSCALAGVLVLSLSLAGCGPPEEPTVPTEPTGSVEPTAPPAVETTSVRIYLVRGESLGVAGREVAASEDEAVLVREALEELVAAPSSADASYELGSTVPQGTEVLGVEVDDGTATVDLSRAFESGGGSLSMLLRVAQVVYTATQFEGIDRVAFKLDGEEVEAIGGEGVIVDPPVTRADFEGQTPPILIESPVPGAVIERPVTISGTANVFEAQFNAKVVDEDEDTLADVAVRATSGTGTRGTFEAGIDYSRPSGGTGAVIVYDLSEKDGSVIDEVRVPVTFE